MNQTIVLLSICATVAVLPSMGFPRSLWLPRYVQAQTQCSLESKSQYHKDFLTNSAAKSDQPNALEAANKYLACRGDPEDLANLNLAVGLMLRKNNSPEEAIPYFIKAASYDSKIKTSPETYFYLAEAYEKGPYERLAAEYRRKFAGKDETKQGLLALKNILQIVDRMIDAYARAVALSGDDWRSQIPLSPGPRFYFGDSGFSQSICVGALTDWYRFRHDNSDSGLKEMIEKILSLPLPPEPIPITSLPPRRKTTNPVKDLA